MPKRVGVSSAVYGAVLIAVLALGLRAGWFWTLIVGVLYALQLRRRWKWAKRGYSGDPRWARDWSVERDPAYEFRGISAFTRGDIEAARDLFRKALDTEAASGRLLYNLACAEARTGDSDAALEHLQAAVKDDPRRLERARPDEDLASIRDDPRFPAAGSP
jgi:tetratricopeptide (TPR) repeat protein